MFCLNVFAPRVQCKDIGASGTGVTVMSHYVVAGNQTLEEQPVLLNTEPSLQPIVFLRFLELFYL